MAKYTRLPQIGDDDLGYEVEMSNVVGKCAKKNNDIVETTILFPDGTTNQTLHVSRLSTIAFLKTQIEFGPSGLYDPDAELQGAQDISEQDISEQDVEAQRNQEDLKEDVKQSSALLAASDAADSEAESPDWGIELVFMGQKLKDTETLQSAGIEDGCSIHCLRVNLKLQKEAEEAALTPEEPESPHIQNVDAAMAGPADPQQPNIGTRFDFALGLVLGMLLGFIALIWVWQWRVSRRQKMGIMLGIMINIIFSFMNDPGNSNDNTGDLEDSGIVITQETSR